jgi:hypothetical protein
LFKKDTQKRQHRWLRFYVKSRRVEFWNPAKVTGFFNVPNLSSRTMALGLNDPLTEMSTRDFPGVQSEAVA